MTRSRRARAVASLKFCFVFASAALLSGLPSASDEASGVALPSPHDLAQPAAAIARTAATVVPATVVQTQLVWAGFAAGPLPPVLAERLGLGPDVGVVVVALHPQGPATRAGLRDRDVILTVDGQEIDSVARWAEQVARLEAGTTLELVVLRDGERTTVQLTLEPRPPEPR